MCPARARCSPGGGPLGVGDEMTPDDVAEASLEGADRFAWRVALGELAFVEAAPDAVAVTEPRGVVGIRGSTGR